MIVKVPQDLICSEQPSALNSEATKQPNPISIITPATVTAPSEMLSEDNPDHPNKDPIIPLYPEQKINKWILPPLISSNKHKAVSYTEDCTKKI